MAQSPLITIPKIATDSVTYILMQSYHILTDIAIM